MRHECLCPAVHGPGLGFFRRHGSPPREHPGGGYPVPVACGYLLVTGVALIVDSGSRPTISPDSPERVLRSIRTLVYFEDKYLWSNLAQEMQR
jgi:hypothetical protein